MYNPEYCSRPHVVALNKMDLPEGLSRQQQSVEGILAAAETGKEDCPTALAPTAVVPTSAVNGMGVGDVGDWIQKILEPMQEVEDDAELEPADGRGGVWFPEEEDW
eukprot:evm.model.scf_1207.1 EVM.evm.TU.scf_1207.1   scf_1207:1673-1990(+)